MAEPPLHQVGRDIGLKRADPEAMTKSFGARTDSEHVGSAHRFFDPTPSRRSAPAPQPAESGVRVALTAADLERSAQVVQQHVRQGHLPDEAGLSPL
jgi:hypothetical protein